MQPSRAFLTTLAALLALFHAVLAVTATTEMSTTADEIGHLTAGLAYNQRADFRLQPENGNLPQRWAALPLTLTHQALPPPSDAAWTTADVWKYGHAFFYEQGLSTDEFLFWGRAMVALVSAGTGLLIFCWSRHLFGTRGAFLSLLLFIFSPSFLAHGALATSDCIMSFCFLASVGAWWRHLHRPGAGGAALSAVLLGLAFVAKFSAVFLLPMLAATALIWVRRESRLGSGRRAFARLARTGALHFAVTWAVIWMFYGFRYSAFAPEFSAHADFNHSWNWILEGLGTPGRIIAALRDDRLLPEAWLYGLAFVLGFSEARGAFLNGEYSVTGWISFFPFAQLVKTPIPLLLLLAGGAVAATWRAAALGLRRTLASLEPLTPLICLFAIYWGFSLTSHLNIGERHILPTYPVLFIAAGWLGKWLDFRRPFVASMLAALVLWNGIEALRFRPHSLAYFNQWVGGPENGWRHLVDSSLDWGQDLPGLERWLAQNNAQKKTPVFLAYFGTGEPDYENIPATRLQMLPNFGHFYPWRPLTAGLYCISATLRQQVYSDQHRWTLPLEKEYQQLRLLEPLFLAESARPLSSGLVVDQAAIQEAKKVRQRYESLRFARLCYYLQVRPADANVGYSIFIFRLSAAEVQAATGDSLAAWQKLIEETFTAKSSRY